MPIYELVCKECGNQHERIVSFSTTTFPACPVCGSAEISRLPSKPAIHFKGSGWYITDSKNDDTKRKAEKADSDDDSAGESTDSEAESKSDAKNPTKTEES